MRGRPMGHEGRSWLDRCRLYRDRLIASPRVQRWALANPVTRPVAQRHINPTGTLSRRHLAQFVSAIDITTYRDNVQEVTLWGRIRTIIRRASPGSRREESRAH